MCGRFTLLTPLSDVSRQFRITPPPWLIPRSNIAPTQSVLGIRCVEGHREAVLFRWGLVPSWADDPSLGNRMINARGEAIANSTAYREAFQQRRCLILADGFFVSGQNSAGEQPFYFRRPDAQPFAFAGLWERWHSDEQTIESCTIITTAANAVVEPVHIRVPVILSSSDYDRWLDPEIQEVEQLQAMLCQARRNELYEFALSTIGNAPKSDVTAHTNPIAVN
jgi:putative SOS response-associated peptidase YedK